MLDRILIGSSAEPSDPNFRNVTLLLHGDGSNGAQNNTFLDSSTNNFTITRNGNTTQGSFSPYGSNWSNYFDGSTSYLSSATSSAYAMGTGDFTIEGWFFTTASADQALFDNRASTSSASGIACRLVTSTNTLRVILNNTALFTTSQAVTLNQWNHIAIVRSSGTVTAYLNGTAMTGGSATGTTNITDTNMLIGKLQDAGFFYNGYISNFRVVKGTAVYTANFTPSTTPLTAITNTSLLTCQSNRFIDNSTNNFTITRNGDVKVSNFAPFAPSSSYSTSTNGGSGYFDGSGDYLYCGANSAFAFGTGNFTVEFFLYTTSTASQMIYDTIQPGISGGGSSRFYVHTNTSQQIVVGPATSTLTTTGTITLGAWNHIAVVRNGSTRTVYINGVSAGSDTFSGNLSSGYATVGFDAASGGSIILNGYLSNLRAVKGTAVYTSAFTPPTAPVTAITNTSLLLNATNGAIFDNSMKNDLETVGNAQISTSVKKFGTGSIYVPSGGGCALIPNSQPLTLGTGNWTIEFWAYTDASGTKVYMDLLNVANTVIYGEMYSSGTTLYWYRDGSNFITGTGALTANTWQHIAVAKSGTSTKLFVNGTQVGSTLTDSFDYASARWEIGGRSNLTLPIVGYIDDLRITNGVARYTANFTAPTAPFPNK